jgi:hypothetical protein
MEVPLMSKIQPEPFTGNASPAELEFLEKPLSDIGFSAEFVSRLSSGLKVETVREFISFPRQNFPATLGTPDLTRDVLSELQDHARGLLDVVRGRDLFSKPIDPLDQEIASQVTMLVDLDVRIQAENQAEETVGALERVASTAWELVFDLKRYDFRIPGVWPPWQSNSASTPATGAEHPDSTTPPDTLESDLFSLYRPALQRASKPRIERRMLMLDALKKAYRAALTTFQSGVDASVALRIALEIPDGEPLPNELDLSREVSAQTVEKLALSFSAVALALDVERSRLPSAQDRMEWRNGPVGAIPRNWHWREFERWRQPREDRGATYYRVAKVIMAWPALRNHFDPDGTLDLGTLEKRLRKRGTGS